jgi:hypothetical protein
VVFDIADDAYVDVERHFAAAMPATERSASHVE